MTIVCNYLWADHSDKWNPFVPAAIIKMAMAHPHFYFVLINDQKNSELNLPPNVIEISYKKVRPTILNQFLVSRYKVPGLLKKYKAGVFLSTGLLVKYEIPQVLILQDAVIVKAGNRKGTLTSKKHIGKAFIKKAKHCIFLSNWEQSISIKKYSLDPKLVTTIYPGPPTDVCESLSFSEREHCKQQYADGNEYFIYYDDVLDPDAMIVFLKAFSAFKKRQRSGMRLIVVVNTDLQQQQMEKILSSYRFKKEVNLQNGLSRFQIIELISAAYAWVDCNDERPFSERMLLPLQAQIPSVLCNHILNEEVFGEAAIYVQANNHKDIAEKLMQIYKDEKLRKDLMANTKKEINKYNWDNSVASLLDIIQKTLI